VTTSGFCYNSTEVDIGALAITCTQKSLAIWLLWTRCWTLRGVIPWAWAWSAWRRCRRLSDADEPDSPWL